MNTRKTYCFLLFFLLSSAVRAKWIYSSQLKRCTASKSPPTSLGELHKKKTQHRIPSFPVQKHFPTASSLTTHYKLIFEGGTALPSNNPTTTTNYDDPFYAIEMCMGLMKAGNPPDAQPLGKEERSVEAPTGPTVKPLLLYLSSYQRIKKMRLLLYKRLVSSYLNPNQTGRLQKKMFELFLQHFRCRADPNAHEKEPAYQPLLAYTLCIENKKQPLPKVICKEIVRYLWDPFSMELLKKTFLATKSKDHSLPKAYWVPCKRIDFTQLTPHQNSSGAFQLINQFQRLFISHLLEADLFIKLYRGRYLEKTIERLVYGALLLLYIVWYILFVSLGGLPLGWGEHFLKQQNEHFFFTLLSLLSGKFWGLFITDLFFSNYSSLFYQQSVNAYFKWIKGLSLLSGLTMCVLYFSVSCCWLPDVKAEKGWQLGLTFTGLTLGEQYLNDLMLSYLPHHISSDTYLSRLIWGLVGGGFACLTFYLAGWLV